MATGKPTTENHLLRGVTISRLMGPNEANVNGNVHGGHILNLIDEAGIVISSRYCNNAPNRDPDVKDDAVTVLARIEHMDFLLPMHIGEVAELEAEIVFTSNHSLEVIVTVFAENIINGEKRLTNRARLWYVAMSIQKPSGDCLPVPPMIYENEELQQRGSKAYLRQKESRKMEKDAGFSKPLNLFPHDVKDPEPFTVSYSTTCLSVLIGRSDVTFHGHCRGGVILKLMDECAGITARKHCQNVTVTAGIEATNFHKKIPIASLVNVYGWINFTSNKSLEIEVVVELEMPFKHGSANNRAVDAIFTFVSIDKQDRALSVPPLKVVTEDEMKRFDEGKQRYEMRKSKRESLRKHYRH